MDDIFFSSIAVFYCFPLILLFFVAIINIASSKIHYKSIHTREQNFLNKPTLTFEEVTLEQDIISAELISASYVFSCNYFKRFLLNIRSFFGGESKAISELFDRARREVILRMKESSPDADYYLNLRIETSNINYIQSKQKSGSIEVFAYSTAIKIKS